MGIDANDVAEKVAEKVAQIALGKIPEVGGFLSSMVPLFFPESGPDLWIQVKEKTESLIQQDIAAYNYNQLNLTLQGIHDNLLAYSKYTDATEKREKLSAIDSAINMSVPKFLAGDPGRGFSCFWGMALLHLSVRAELADVFQDEANRQLLKEATQAYAAFALTGMHLAHNERMAQIHVDSGSWADSNGPDAWVYGVAVRDTTNGQQLYSASNFMDPWTAAQLRSEAASLNAALNKAWTSFSQQLLEHLQAGPGSMIDRSHELYPIDQNGENDLLGKLMTESDYHDYVCTYLPQSILTTCPVLKLCPDDWPDNKDSTMLSPFQWGVNLGSVVPSH